MHFPVTKVFGFLSMDGLCLYTSLKDSGDYEDIKTLLVFFFFFLYVTSTTTGKCYIIAREIRD